MIDWVNFTPWASLAGGVLIGLAAALFAPIDLALHAGMRLGVVDYLVKAKREDLLTENADGNQVVGKAVLAAFRKLVCE